MVFQSLLISLPIGLRATPALNPMLNFSFYFLYIYFDLYYNYIQKDRERHGAVKKTNRFR